MTARRPSRSLRPLLLGLLCTAGVLGSARLDAQSDTIWIGGAAVDAQTIVFCVDRSSTMGGLGAWELQRDLVISALEQLGPTQSFDIVAFGFSLAVWDFPAVPVTPASVQSAIAYLSALTTDGEGGMQWAVLEALQIIAGAPDAAVVLFSDQVVGATQLAQIPAMVQSANLFSVPIHTFRLPMVEQRSAVGLLEGIATLNGGMYVELTEESLDPLFIRGDANGDGTVDLADAVTLLGSLFVGGFPPIVPPSPGCGTATNVFPCVVSSCP